MTPSTDLARQVEARAAGRCEYCRMHQSLQGATFHVEHVVPRSRGGASTLENLAWACPGCNLRKSDRVDVPDPDSGVSVSLFNPRIDRWNEHFAWNGYEVTGLTGIGRATVAALDFNHPRRVRIRQAEESFDLFPPDDD
jgi:HNH endonuclease